MRQVWPRNQSRFERYELGRTCSVSGQGHVQQDILPQLKPKPVFGHVTRSAFRHHEGIMKCLALGHVLSGKLSFECKLYPRVSIGISSMPTHGAFVSRVSCLMPREAPSCSLASSFHRVCCMPRLCVFSPHIRHLCSNVPLSSNLYNRGPRRNRDSEPWRLRNI
jgi:hypothetical protein